MNNIILNTDSYKFSHWVQYPPGTEAVYSYIESRGGLFDTTVFFGLQAFIKEYLEGEVVTKENVEEAAEIASLHGVPFNKEGWMYIVEKHNGRLPVTIRAVPEGYSIPVKNVLAVIENTDPECFWLTSYLETALLRAVWYPTTVATLSKTIKNIILNYLQMTGDESLIDFKLHDFGPRGVSSEESSELGGLAHLVNFKGTDNISALVAGRKFYNEKMAGFSIPAAEHSTITSWGRENEMLAYRNMIKQYGHEGAMFAVVSDSYDIFNAVENIWGKQLKFEVLESGATLVVRPDSGDPATVVLKVAQLLEKTFNVTYNNKGYKVLNNVRIIQGDGINIESIREILETLKINGYSADNIAFGMGGALLQGVNRDTQKFAMKCSSIKISGEWQGVSKDPVTDPGKTSKKGRVTLFRNRDGSYHSGVEDWETPMLIPVFENGRLITEYTLEDVRKNSNEY